MLIKVYHKLLNISGELNESDPWYL